MLAFDIEGRRVLDLFAGSGQMGLEALSRGAASVTMVDCAKAAVEIIKKNTAKTKLQGAETVCADCVNWLEGAAKKGISYDIVFMDPPYNSGYEERVLNVLAGMKYVTEDTLIIVEAALKTKTDYLETLGFELIREKNYKTNKHLFIKKRA